jgi:hypothetical protein
VGVHHPSAAFQLPVRRRSDSWARAEERDHLAGDRLDLVPGADAADGATARRDGIVLGATMVGTFSSISSSIGADLPP